MENSVWSKDYQSAKQKFHNCIDSLRSKNINVSHDELNINELDPYGNDLLIDVVWIGDSNAEKVYMSTSGIHGVEGFAGSAIQLTLLNNLNEIPKNTAFIFVHVLNPWGMSWIRRENESNVDLNRNFLTNDEPYKGSHPHYAKLDPIINIKKLPQKINLFNIRMLMHGLIHGQIKTKQAYAEGQYDFPKGLHFGGDKLEKGPRHFIDWLKIKLVNVKRCVWIDLHTGLGESGEDALLVDLSPDDKKYIELENQAFGHRIASLDPKAGVAYKIRGGMQKGTELRFPNINWTSITQEFGTIPGVSVIQSLRSESSWNHYSNKEGLDLLNHWSKKDLLAAFRPFDNNWENKIISRGDTFFNQTLRFLLN
tara:strand:+ start:770 stop:1867 length:1098 start_codon:yes stop_codon:yes gene_type:complete